MGTEGGRRMGILGNRGHDREAGVRARVWARDPWPL